MKKKDKKEGPVPTKPAPTEVMAVGTAEGMVVRAPKPETEPTQMTEQAEDVLAGLKSAIKEPLKNKILKLVGQQMSEVQAELERLVVLGEVGSFRLLGAGEMFDGDFVSNRVQVIGLSGECKDVQVG